MTMQEPAQIQIKLGIEMQVLFAALQIQVGYESTGKAICKCCKQKIARLRLAYSVRAGSSSLTHWYHFACFELKPAFADIDPDQQIVNFNYLDEIDQQELIDYIAEEKDRIKSGEKKAKPEPVCKVKGGKGAKMADDQDGDALGRGNKKSKKNAKKAKKQLKSTA